MQVIWNVPVASFSREQQKYEDIFLVNTFGGFLFESAAREFPIFLRLLRLAPYSFRPIQLHTDPFIFSLLSRYSCRHTIKADSMNCKEIIWKHIYYIHT